MNQVTKVQAGETIPYPSGDQIVGITVEPACDQNVGHWYCVTHSEGFLNNMSYGGHVEEGTHRMVWVCHLHGPETP